MKKSGMILIAAMLAAGMLAGCGSGDTTSTVSITSDTISSSEVGLLESSQGSELPTSSTPPVETSVVSSDISSAGSKPASSATSSKPASATVSSQAPASSTTPQQICKAIAAAYGDDYYPNTEMPLEQIYGNFPIDKTLVESVYGEMPMISVNPDQLIVMKAVAGKGAQLESAMKTARDKYVKEAMVYPKDTAKLNASRVVRSGDYVAFLMVGAVDEVNDDINSTEAQKFAQDQIAIGVRAFQNAAK